MIFRQLFEPLSSTYTYLIGCERTKLALLIDPAYPTWERDLTTVSDLGLTLTYTLETHVHADHITAALQLKKQINSKIVYPRQAQCECADLYIEEGAPFSLGDIVLQPLYTPGHTDDHYCYYLPNDRVMTGDALLIDGCGRTDFQNGNPAELYNSIRTKLFSLPDDTLVFPGHDYNNRHVSTIAQEKARNPRIGMDKSEADFKHIMQSLNLDYPKFIDHAVPGNRQCGVCPGDLPENLESYCEQQTLSPQG